MAKTYTVYYRTGGTENCTWKKAFPVATRDLARKQQAEIQQMGYKALIAQTSRLDAIGLPEGWTAEHTQWRMSQLTRRS